MAVLCFILLLLYYHLSLFMESCDLLTHISQGCFIHPRTMPWIPQYQWSHQEGYQGDWFEIKHNTTQTMYKLGMSRSACINTSLIHLKLIPLFKIIMIKEAKESWFTSTILSITLNKKLFHNGYKNRKIKGHFQSLLCSMPSNTKQTI